MQNKSGILYVVATPIGNLQDITYRAVEILKQVDLIAAEDTRHTQALLNHYSIKKPIISLHNFNEREFTDELLARINDGNHCALVSDAGTPLISDPGHYLVKSAQEAKIKVVPIPGPCAAIAALSVASLPADKFMFEGFLPPKEEARCKRIEVLKSENRTIVLYEAPHRLLATLKDLNQILGDRKATVARELTKIYEDIKIDSLTKLHAYYQEHTSEVRGEIVILIEGLKEGLEDKKTDAERILNILMAELPLKQAVTLTSKISGERKNLLYEKALTQK